MAVDSSYWLVQDDAGYLLRAGDRGTGRSALADDGCMWLLKDGELQSATGQPAFTTSASEDGCYSLDSKQAGSRLPGRFRIEPGPTSTPSAHLAELRTNGFTIVHHVIGADAIERLKADIARVRAERYADEAPTDGHFWIMDGLSWSAELARAATHPVALWILEQYMATDAIHFCHQPIITTLKPAAELLNTCPEGGWHSDYPYHPGVFPDDEWPQDRVFGAQYNVCIDPFTARTGATQFVPGSHELCHWPPDEFNLGGTRAGQGIHRDVRQLEAPAGAALIYDARTWHRACHELNVSGRDRIALLNAVAPAWVPPMIDKEPVAEKYRTSVLASHLSERVANDVRRLCNSATLARPDDVPELNARREHARR